MRFSCTHAPSVGSRLACNWLLHSCLLIFLGAKGAEDFRQVIDFQRFAGQGARQVQRGVAGAGGGGMPLRSAGGNEGSPMAQKK